MITATGLPSASDANASYTTPSGTLTAVQPGFTASEATTIFSSATPLRPTHELTTTLALTPHLGSLHGQQHMKYTQFAPHRYRLHNRLLVT